MKTVNCVPFTDLLYHATKMGYDWNLACDFMNCLRPQYEITSREYGCGDFWIDYADDDLDLTGEKVPGSSYSATDDAIKVMVSFFEENDVDEILVTAD